MEFINKFQRNFFVFCVTECKRWCTCHFIVDRFCESVSLIGNGTSSISNNIQIVFTMWLNLIKLNYAYIVYRHVKVEKEVRRSINNTAPLNFVFIYQKERIVIADRLLLVLFCEVSKVVSFEIQYLFAFQYHSSSNLCDRFACLCSSTHINR